MTHFRIINKERANKLTFDKWKNLKQKKILNLKFEQEFPNKGSQTKMKELTCLNNILQIMEGANYNKNKDSNKIKCEKICEKCNLR